MMPMTASKPIREPDLSGFGEHRDGDADVAVGAELEQHRGQDDRALGGRLGVGVGQPGVEREQRHLDAEADEHAAEDEQLAAAHDAGTGRVGQLDHVEGAEQLTGDGVLRQEEKGEEAEQHHADPKSV